MPAVPADKLDFSAAPVVLTVSAPPQMAEIPVIISAPGTRARPPGLTLRILALALLGGLILNLMPCVLPVLALKLSAVIGVVGASRQELRLRFLAGAAGILASFLLLAGGLALVRLAGGTVGWGIQFQNPAFLMVMMVMLGIFALSLLDLVIIPVPRFAQRLAGISGHSARHGYSGDFLAGMLATILATPCSAPLSVRPSLWRFPALWPTCSGFSWRLVSGWRPPGCWWRHSLRSSVFFRVQVPGCPG